MREVELVLVRAEVGEEVEHLVQRPVGLGIGLVDLVQDDDGPQPERERLGGHEFRLRHRAFGGVDQKDDSVDHAQDPLDLAAEIGVARRVDDVDPRALPLERGRLGKNGDPALAFQIVGIHCAFGHGLSGAEGARLLEQFVDEGGLAMIDVCDDRNVAKFHERVLGRSARPLPRPGAVG